MSRIFAPLNMCLLMIGIVIALSFTTFAETALVLGLYFIIILIVLFIHELGHVIGGKLAGYQFLYMTVGPITIQKDPNLKIVPNPSWTAFGGIANCTPAEANLSNLVKRHKIYVAGGPVFTGIAFIAGLLIWFVTEHEIAMAFMVLNAAIFLATATPFRGTFRSDGSVYLLLHKGGKEAETFLAGLLLLKEMMSPKKPTDWDKSLIEEAQKTEVSIETTTTAFLLFYYYLVTANYERASESIALYNQIPVTKKTKFNLQFIMHIQQIDSFFSNEPDVSFIKSVHKQLSNMEPISYKRSEAMLAHLEGNREHAIRLLEEVLEKCTKGIEQYGFFEAERKLTLIVMEKIQVD